MKKKYLLFVCIIVPFLVSAQANKWINYSQYYFKIKIAKDGIYLVDSATLANGLASVGISLSTLDPRQFQLYFHGQQQYVYIKGESDGVFNGPKSGNDYLEFYGQHNTGALIHDEASDSLLYSGITAYPDSAIAAVPNPYYSMYTDTSTYFLTWSNTGPYDRMGVTHDTTFSTSTSYPYFWAQNVLFGNIQQGSYCSGATINIGELVNDPRYTAAVGYYLLEVNSGTSVTSAPLGFSQYVYANAPSAYIKTFFEGQNNPGGPSSNDHRIQVYGSWSPDTLSDNTFPGFGTYVKKYYVTANQLKTAPGGNITLQFNSVTCPSAGGIQTYTGVNYMYIQYPHTMDLENKANYMMYVLDTTSRPYTYLNFTDLNASSKDTVRLYDLTNHQRLVVTQQSGNYKVIMNSTTHAMRQCYVIADTEVYHVTKIIPEPGTNNLGKFTQFGPSFSATNNFLIVYHPSLVSVVNQYATYRAQKYHPVTASTEELYDQFCYGIEKDPLAIRNFCAYALGHSKSIAGLFLFGKGMRADSSRAFNSDYNNNLVPTFGSYPASDVLLTVGLNPKFPAHDLRPAIPTGRLAAINTTEAEYYYNKVVTYETNPPALWQKNIIHFSGGGDAGEQQQIYNCLAVDADTAEGVYYGANVTTIQKTTTAPIQVTLADSIADMINNGVSLMTFYGHASGQNFDINLDAPSDYNNYNKYPMILALACFAGDIYEPVNGSSGSYTDEQFVLDKKGSIGFIAQDDVSELGLVCNYSQYLYQDFSTLMYREPIASCMQDVIGKVEGNGYDIGTDLMCMEMQLHGDPVLFIGGGKNDSLRPDYAVNDSSLTFIPSTVTTQMNSFQVKLTVQNLAMAVNGKISIQIDRYRPNGTDTTMHFYMSNIYYTRDTILTFSINKATDEGINYFSVRVNTSLSPKEITYNNNNIYNIPLVITSGDIIPIYPYQFAIIPKDTATLKASTGNPFAPTRNYLFEIDTTIYFNSPFLKAQVVNAKGGVVEAPFNKWENIPGGPPMYTGIIKGNVTLKFKDSTVYYWRARFDTSDVKDYGWEESSFQYITGKSGWGQSHYFQFDNNQYTYLSQQMKARDWVFSPTGKTLQCTACGTPYTNKLSDSAWENTGYYLDVNLVAYNGCTVTPELCLAVIDPVSLTPWTTAEYNLGNDNNATSGCNYPVSDFIYWYNDKNAFKGLENALNTIPNNYYVLIYSFGEGMFQSWADKKGLDSILINKYGASSAIDTTPDHRPFIFFAQKGNKSMLPRTIIGTDSISAVKLNINLTNNAYSGSMVTPLIGPAQKWDSISWRQHSMVKNAVDSVRMNVMAIDKNGNTSTLMNGVTPAVANMYIKSLNPVQFPYLQLMLYTKDAVTHTPSQMNKWQVFYTPVPEVALNPSIYSYFYGSDLIGGDTVKFKTVVQNVSDYTMDSMLVNAYIINSNGSRTTIPESRLTKKLKPGDTTMISAKWSTFGLSGTNSIFLEVNPLNNTLTRPEQYHFNNIAFKSFIASGDRNSPLLDVTFDGIHILNDEIVSPRPNILMEITSDNKFLALNSADTSNIAVYLTNLNGTNPSPQRIYFGGTQLQFTPAVLPDNRCKVLYTPTLTDGTYELNVQAADRSNNLAAANSYKIDFNVVTKSSITNVLNYPNPFSTSTRFVFTLTGDQIPTYFKIQVMTITGKVVREITENELGPIHIGLNITEYAWDGTDQFGAKLANGVYLYHVITSIDNQSIDHMSTEADSYFTKGWGKMYIIR